jgi:hypothetical protein
MSFLYLRLPRIRQPDPHLESTLVPHTAARIPCVVALKIQTEALPNEQVRRLRSLFAAVHESPCGPKRRLLRDSNTFGVEGKADVTKPREVE